MRQMQESLDKIVKMQLSDGSQLEFHMAPRLEAALRSQYNLSVTDELSDDLLKEFLLATFSRAETPDDD